MLMPEVQEPVTPTPLVPGVAPVIAAIGLALNQREVVFSVGVEGVRVSSDHLAERNVLELCIGRCSCVSAGAGRADVCTYHLPATF